MKSNHLLWACGMLAIAAATPVCAQDAQGSRGSSVVDDQTGNSSTHGSTDEALSQDVIVTALRRSESLLRTPAALTVIPGGDLKTRGINTVADLQNLVPGVNISTGQDGVTIGIRGVQTTDFSSKGEDDVAFNVDGVYIGRRDARATEFFDIDRVEVLRGPQGTLYGRSSTGGAVNLITAKPKLNEYSGYVRAEYGNYDAKRAEGAINFPIGDTLAIRAAGSIDHRDGYAIPVDYNPTVNGVTYHFPAGSEQPRNDQVDATGRFSALFQPSDSLSARVTTTIGNQRGFGPANLLEDFLTGASGQNRFGILASPIPNFLRSHFFSVDGGVNVHVGAAQLDLLASHQLFDRQQQRSNTNSIFDNNGQLGLILEHQRAGTTELEARVSNFEPSRIDYVAGVNYFNERIFENGHLWNAPPATYQDTSTWQQGVEIRNNTNHKAYGVFGQATFHLADRLGLVAGARYTHDAVDRIGILSFPFIPCTYPNQCNGIPNNGSNSDQRVTWRAGVNFQMTSNHLLYASVATGFKGGGFNDYDPASTNAAHTGTYAPSSLTAYEVGYKGRPLPGLTLASDLFYYDFDRDQITGQVTFPASGQTTIFTTTTPAVIYGWENEASVQLGKLTSISGTMAYERSRFVNFMAGYIFGDQVSWRGLDLDQTPRFTLTAALDHAVALPGDGKLRFRAQFKYSDGYYLSDIANAVRYRQHAFTRSDATLTYAASGDRYTVQLFVENVENEVQRTGALTGYTCPYAGTGGQCQSGFPAMPVYPRPGNGTVAPQPFGYLNFATTTPRFYGVRLSAKF